MAKNVINQDRCTLERLLRDLKYCVVRVETLYAHACAYAYAYAPYAPYAPQAPDREEKNEDKEKGKEKPSPHTPYKEKEKDQKEKEERKEETLAHPADERARMRLKMSELFDKFWRAYPRKVAKIAAERKFETIVRREKRDPEALVDRMCRALAKQREGDEWQRENGRYIPYPATWLNAGRWEDESEIDELGDAPANAASLAWLLQR